MPFTNRHHAGKELALVLRRHVTKPAIVYALPRGGVPVAAEVAEALDVPLDLVIARKIGHPHSPEYAIGAVTETGQPVFNEDERRTVDPVWLATRIAAERSEARRRRELYCAGLVRKSAEGRCAILVDDGIATGLTMEAAVREVKADRPSKLIVAVAVSPRETADRFAKEVDRFVAVEIPDYFEGAVGAYYQDFRQVTDDDVQRELARLWERESTGQADVRS
jgi:predicted phosphoribosyltransferase